MEADLAAHFRAALAAGLSLLALLLAFESANARDLIDVKGSLQDSILSSIEAE